MILKHRAPRPVVAGIRLKVLPVVCRRIPSRRLRTFGVWVSSPARETGRGFFLLWPIGEPSLCFQDEQLSGQNRTCQPANQIKHRTMKYLTKEQQIVLGIILL